MAENQLLPCGCVGCDDPPCGVLTYRRTLGKPLCPACSVGTHRKHDIADIGVERPDDMGTAWSREDR